VKPGGKSVSADVVLSLCVKFRANKPMCNNDRVVIQPLKWILQWGPEPFQIFLIVKSEGELASRTSFGLKCIYIRVTKFSFLESFDP